jgi:hypothetical protein
MPRHVEAERATVQVAGGEGLYMGPLAALLEATGTR